MPSTSIQTEYDSPIIFRTCDQDVYNATCDTGSLWLRTSNYYRKIEDMARRDLGEGITGTSVGLELSINPENANGIRLEGTGTIGCEIIPHYLISFHGAAIKEQTRRGFGGYTLGIKSLTKLSAEIVYQASLQVDVTGYRYGPVSYQNTALTLSHSGSSAAIEMTGAPAVYLKSINTDVLRKLPVEPFISQDEWRIALFVKNYLKDEINEPLKINVSPTHFYKYMAL